MTFRVGQKVVCVDGVPDDGRQFIIPLREGAIYTIRGFVRAHYGRDETCLHLCGIVNPAPYSECGFRAARFRPLVERKTDISIFHRMLTPTTSKRARKAAV